MIVAVTGVVLILACVACSGRSAEPINRLSVAANR
jgi:hypothetical protein